MSRADVKRMRGEANIYSRKRCANDQIYTSADYSGVYSFRMLDFNEAHAKRERERERELRTIKYTNTLSHRHGGIPLCESRRRKDVNIPKMSGAILNIQQKCSLNRKKIESGNILSV